MRKQLAFSATLHCRAATAPLPNLDSYLPPGRGATVFGYQSGPVKCAARVRQPPVAMPAQAISMGIDTPYSDEDLLVDDDIGSRLGEPWKVILYNDDIHTFEEVIVQLQKALGCGQSRAEQIALEAHSRGKAIAYNGKFEECFRIMGILRQIQLIVEIEG